MSEFPITIQKLAYEHKGGTKEYHLLFISNSDGTSILVRRWGKVGRATNIMIDTEGVSGAALQRHQNERRTKGYQLVSLATQTVVAHDFNELVAAVSRPVWAKFGADAIAKICPSVDVSGLKPSRGPEYDEDGHKIENGSLKEQAANLLEQVKAAKKDEARTANSTIAGFGRF